MAKSKRPKYSTAEKRAYNMGYGIGLKVAGKQGRCTSVNGHITQSFNNGYYAGMGDTDQQTKRRLTSRKKVSKSQPRTAPFTTDKKGRINGYNPKYPHKEPDLFIESALLKRELF